MFVVEVTDGLTVRFNVATESQPAAFVKVTDCEPAALKVNPFQLYGNWASQIVMFVVEVTDGLTVRFNVATESQPAAFVKVTDCEPAALKVKPFQVYGNCASHIVMFVVEVTDGLTLRFNVATESQPAAFVKVTDCEPAALKVKPFQM